jgi:hypothetical protein
MPKILPNRSSKTLTAENMEAIKGALQVLVDNLGVRIVITDDEYKGLAKLGDFLKPICDSVFAIAQQDPTYLEDEQSVEEVQKDKVYNEQTADVLKSLYEVVFLYERENGTSGAEYRNAISNYEGNVKDKVKKGSSTAQLTLDKLNRIDRGTRVSPPSPPTTPLVEK